MDEGRMRLDRDQLVAAVAPLNRARSMPAGFYTSPEIFELERTHIFLKGWFFLAREDQLPQPGDYRAFDTPGGPIVLIRGRDGTLRCFANYCRHRGSILLEGEGRVQGRIVCPYHAWSYLTDGTLYGCPDMQDAEGFDRVENGLVPLRLESWAGFLFASFDRAAEPLIRHLGDLPSRFASHRLDRMRCTWRMTLEPRCNWKLILENAMETYHTGIVHRNTVGAQQSRTLPTRGNWLCIQVLSDRSIATLPDTAPPFPPIAGLDEDARMGTYFTVIHPTCQFAVAQDCLWWLNVTPVAADRSVLEIGGCFPEDALDLPDFAERAAPYYVRWEAVGREDVGILEKQQRALGSVLFKPGPLSWRDDMVQALGKWVLERLPI
jgi:phenylpropionate dioxygenase-like ring-hydroxylating dioxygenase large terminal subunit